MLPLPEASTSASRKTSTIAPLACLFAVVLLLSSVTLVIKYVFQHSAMQPIGLARFRVLIGFVILLAITLFWDRRGLFSLAIPDLVKLGLLGSLAVLSNPFP